MYDTAGVRRTVPCELADKFPEFFRATDAQKLARASCFPASFHEWLKNKPRKPHTDLRVKSSGALSNVSENDLGQAPLLMLHLCTSLAVRVNTVLFCSLTHSLHVLSAYFAGGLKWYQVTPEGREVVRKSGLEGHELCLDHICPESIMSSGIGISHVANFTLQSKRVNEYFGDRLDRWQIKMDHIGAVARNTALSLQRYIKETVDRSLQEEVDGEPQPVVLDLKSWRTVIWPSSAISKADYDQIVSSASPHVFITKPDFQPYYKKNLHVKNALLYVPARTPTDRSYVRVQRRVKGGGRHYRVEHREVVISRMMTMISPESRDQWQNLGKWVLEYPMLR
jgi:hypothetical protein